ncbi:glycosyltransferase family 4 protein [Desulfobotulus sp.]|uniref:glycosyltransferase family 4 protein n=1 Tax=Desulfobotulus sp. TaxID=1940337 RepID=UPI002A365F8C|nr:glycosyltransferase family 4 protein [Desulfobotulus sp.]MDY0162976.1 glycosyltransferase family 4 protein [Desulfobotulus sp.]
MVTLDFVPKVGGIAAHVYELSRAMVRLGHSVMVLTRRVEGIPDSENLDGMEVRRIRLWGSAPFYGISTDRAIRGFMKTFSPDCVHVHGMAPLEWLRPLPVPLVYTNHTSGYLARVRKGGLRRMFFLRRHLKRPDLILAPSQELLEIPFSVPGLLRYVPNGVDSERYRFNPADREAVRRDLGFLPEHRVGILTRRMVEKNGVIFFAKAAFYLKADENLRFILVGDGPEAEAVKGLLSQHFRDRFVMTGSLRHEKILPYYSAADFAVLPSLMEATSISGLEAMAFGLPLVGTRVGGIPDLIEEGQTGLLCEPADPRSLAEAILRLQTLDMKAMGVAGRRRVEGEFDWLRIGEKTLAAYKEV